MSEYIDNKTYNESLTSGSQRFALISLTSLFFIWGFITCLNDILIPHLKAVFELNYTQAMLIQFCFFGAYFLVSVPAGALVKRIGFKGGIISGLLIAGLGCILFYPAASVREYWLFLAALFVLAAGITILQVSANPYVTVLGKPETAASRLTLTQAFNSLGTTIAPQFGALIILGGVVTLGVQELAALTPVQLDNYYAEEAASVQVPYLGLAAALFVLAALFAFLKLPTVAFEQQDNTQQADKSAWSHRQLVLGVIAIFVYVGGEVAIGSFIVNFLGEANIAGMAEAEAASYLTYYWMGAMIGRFIGAAVMMKVNAGKVLAFNALAASLLVATAILSSGSVAMWALLAVGLFNSIMFPTIFSLALNGLGSATSQASGALCLGIVGGAIIPLFQGMLADAIGIQLAFVLPIACYLYIAFYGLKGSVVKPQD